MVGGKRMASKSIQAVILSNQGRTPIVVSISESRRPSSERIWTGPTGSITLSPGKRIVVELSRVNFSHLRNLERLGSLKIEQRQQAIVIPDEEEEEAEALDLVFEYDISGSGLTEISPDETVSGLFIDLSDNGSEFRVTNNSGTDANVTAASFSPGTHLSVINFSSSIISSGGTNIFNIQPEIADPFDEDLTITINGVDYTFTLQGTVVSIGA